MEVMQGQAHLAEVVGAYDPRTGVPSALHGGHHQTSRQKNDAENNQHLNERKTPSNQVARHGSDPV
jgi:hypothetical protein